jgi:hypothetical protein
LPAGDDPDVEPVALAAVDRAVFDHQRCETGAFDQAYGSNQQDEIKEPPVKPCSLVKVRSRVMWWSNYWHAPWMFLGPMKMMLVLMAICMAAGFLIIRMRIIHRAIAGTGSVTAGGNSVPLSQHVNARQPDGRHAAFEEYRNETLRRVDQDEREFRALMTHLRMAKVDGAVFDRLRFETGAFEQAFGSN